MRFSYVAGVAMHAHRCISSVQRHNEHVIVTVAFRAYGNICVDVLQFEPPQPGYWTCSSCAYKYNAPPILCASTECVCDLCGKDFSEVGPVCTPQACHVCYHDRRTLIHMLACVCMRSMAGLAARVSLRRARMPHPARMRRLVPCGRQHRAFSRKILFDSI